MPLAIGMLLKRLAYTGIQIHDLLSSSNLGQTLWKEICKLRSHLFLLLLPIIMIIIRISKNDLKEIQNYLMPSSLSFAASPYEERSVHIKQARKRALNKIRELIKSTRWERGREQSARPMMTSQRWIRVAVMESSVFQWWVWWKENLKF